MAGPKDPDIVETKITVRRSSHPAVYDALFSARKQNPRKVAAVALELMSRATDHQLIAQKIADQVVAKLCANSEFQVTSETSAENSDATDALLDLFTEETDL